MFAFLGFQEGRCWLGVLRFLFVSKWKNSQDLEILALVFWRGPAGYLRVFSGIHRGNFFISVLLTKLLTL